MIPCYECGAPATHDHHVVPVCRGGTRTVSLCEECHGKVHGRTFSASLNHRDLTKQGIVRARAAGKQIGAPPEFTPEVEALVYGMRDDRVPLRQIAAALQAQGVPTPRGGSWHTSTIQRILARRV
jgi:hypothetical protein